MGFFLIFQIFFTFPICQNNLEAIINSTNFTPENLTCYFEFMETEMNQLKKNNRELLRLVDEWAPKLKALPEDVITNKRNKQNRNIKQILGHIVDSASNNTHRIIHLQYQQSPLVFPDYANFGNNDRWIAIQSYQTENWYDLIGLWKYSNRHIVHVMDHVNTDKLDNEWITATGEKVSLKAMILDYLRHFKLHLDEINELINK